MGLRALLIVTAALFCAVVASAQPEPRSLQLWHCDTAADTPTLEREISLVKEGEAAQRWHRHPERRRFDIPNLPSDWSGYNRLRFWMHSASAVPGWITVIIRSENPASDGLDYWAFDVSLNFEGWQEVDLEIGLGGGTRFPLGLHKIDALTFTAANYGSPPNPVADLVIDDIHLVAVPDHPGPGIDDVEFFESLDLTLPALASVRDAVLAGDYAAAKAAFLAHLRARETPIWRFDWRDRPPPPPSRGSPGWDYYSTTFVVDWTGWRDIDLPIADWRTTREPIGWQRISRFIMTGGFGEALPSMETALTIDGLRLLSDDPILFGDFESNAERQRWSGYEPTRDSVSSGNVAALWRPEHHSRLTCLSPPGDWSDAHSLRLRIHSAAATGDRITLVAESDLAATSQADATLANTFEGVAMGNSINWHYSKLPRSDPGFNNQMTARLNRFFYWNWLGKAYWSSGDEKYAQGWIAQMRDWITRNPRVYGAYGNNSATWSTIDVGIRSAEPWPNALFHFLSSPSLTADDAVLFLKSWIEHARHLLRITEERPEREGNWVTIECNALGQLALLLPECRESEHWLEVATARLLKEIDRQVYPDGAQKELASGYHLLTFDNFYALQELAVLNHRELPSGYLAGLEKMLAYGLGIMAPDGTLPPVNDSVCVDMLAHLELGAELFADETMRWAASRGMQGSPPSYGSVAFPYAGQYVMRSGWGREDAYLFFEAGPFGMGHQHEDKLNLLIYAGERRLLTEGGNADYDSSPARRYALSSWAHNTVLVDGRGQRRRGRRDLNVNDSPQMNLWIDTPEFDAAAGVYENGYGDAREIRARHERTVVFVKPDYWVVVDRIAASAPHAYDILWHLAAGEAEQDTETLAAWGTDSGRMNLLVTPVHSDALFLDIIRGREDPMLGFAPIFDMKPIPVLDYRLLATGDATIVWILTPFTGARPAVSATTAERDGVLLVTIEHPSGGDELYLAAPNESRVLVPGETALRGSVALIRRNRAGEQLSATSR